jgi:hypothetical protein
VRVQNPVSLIVICIALVAIFFELLAEYFTYVDYFLIQGKSRAFVGVRHLWSLKLCLVGFLGVIVTIVAFFLKEKRKLVAFSLVFSLMAMVLPLLGVWRWFIP